tara:strand:- start:2474 stop:3631 length:1158 start_codon:yes stop_codon:yes gene_type:complete
LQNSHSNVKHAALFEPGQAGGIAADNRIIMAPLTRSRAQQPGDVPNALNATYYGQRAGAGFIITEATQISREGKGYAWTPGIYTPEQVAGWKLVTNEVHNNGGKIVLQLWHVGRISHPVFQKDEGKPVAPSAIRPDGDAFVADYHPDGPVVPFVEPRALEVSEIPRLLQDYVHAARCAKDAGFDGVEIHAANGYLLDQFLQSSTNQRDDAYGGSAENRMRLLGEVVDAVLSVWPADQVGVRLSPLGAMNDISDDNPGVLFPAVAEKLSGRGLAYLHIVRATEEVDGIQQVRDESVAIIADMQKAFDGALLVCGGFSPQEAASWVEEQKCDFTVFGKLFLANPDLPQRFSQDGPYNEPNPKTFYGGGSEGYTDYSKLSEEERRKAA